MSARLAKRDVEALLQHYDTDAVGALTVALRKVLAAYEDASFEALVERAALEPTFAERLRARDTAALDELAARLNEQRTL